jgi:hypothetical protein
MTPGVTLSACQFCSLVGEAFSRDHRGLKAAPTGGMPTRLEGEGLLLVPAMSFILGRALELPSPVSALGSPQFSFHRHDRSAHA